MSGEPTISHWKTYFNGDYNDEITYCEECGHNLEDPSYLPDFCPYCHAPMTEKALHILKGEHKMEQKFIPVRIHPERKRRRRYRPEPFGILLGVLLSVACLLTYTALAINSLAAEPDGDVKAPTAQALPKPSPLVGEEPEEALTSTEVDYSVYVPAADPADMRRLAQMVWGEARGVKSKVEQEAVIWCVFNRIDDPRFPNTIAEVCTQSQFHGYDPDNPVEPEFYDMALSVYNEWYRLHLGDPTAVRTLPVEYVYFHGDGERNWFRTEYEEFENFWEPTHSHYGSDYM